MAAQPFFQRLEILTGPEALSLLDQSRVMVFGLGGVGSWCAEALVRSGIGNIAIVDFDRVQPSNVNRQVEATSRSLGRLKTEALSERLEEINPQCRIESYPLRFSRETMDSFDLAGADYIIDAIDNLTNKLDLIMAAAPGRFFSSMGMAQKMDPRQIRTVDIWDTPGCPLARLVRHNLRKRGFEGNFTTVYSPEQLPRRVKAQASSISEGGKRVINGSAVTVTAVAGFMLAGLVLMDICRRSDGES
ncbi:MAG: tRNA threonylcarbamoyladenosine dehydratase [Treponema sp.]|nr:tRNA threonylcarbamoyladenosine dehydratase [Treponema sp.]